MTGPRALLVTAAVVAALGLARWGLQAQEPAADPSPKASAADAMDRPHAFPFDEPTTLGEVAEHLRKTLGIQVALDLAALKRHELTPQSTVRLRLGPVRLRTGLKLLLEQVDLAANVIAEDNLLILTDAAGADDPIVRVEAELRGLRREVREARDALDDLYDLIVDGEGIGAEVREPAMLPEGVPAAEKPAPQEPAKARPGA